MVVEEEAKHHVRLAPRYHPRVAVGWLPASDYANTSGTDVCQRRLNAATKRGEREQSSTR
jgi:hypothetical protein